MTRRQYSNTATEATLTGGVSSADPSFTLDSFAGYPAAPFTATIARGEADEEVVLVTAVSASTVTATRGYDGTAAKSHAAGATFIHTTIAKDFDEANDHINATTLVHGVVGALVGTTAVQTLTNKTLTSPVITGGTQASPTITTPTITTPAIATPTITGGTQASPSITTPTITNPTIKDAGGATVNHRWVQLTQAAYNALGTKDPAMLYAIVG